MNKGYIQIYTGNGKGKTTAAIGLAIRANGNGLKVATIHFLKSSEKYAGEAKVFKSLGIAEYWFASGMCRIGRKITGISHDSIREECLKGMGFVKKLFKDYDLVILDEINIALRDKFLDKGDILKLIEEKPGGCELIFTGRGAPKWLVEMSDLVTEMRKIKHYYDKGVERRKGVEY